jgi:hypothetical protein
MMLSGYIVRDCRAVAASSLPISFSLFLNSMARILAFAALICASQPAVAQFTQQGQKLVGSSAGAQGFRVALSADGYTAAWGGPNAGSPNLNGGVWVYTRSGSGWTQQGPVLVGSSISGSGAQQGWSVALSADGNTLIEGGPDDNIYNGGAWVFTRSSDGGWTQQGSELIGSNSSSASQGVSVALSADGNTAIVGGPVDNGYIGAAWVYTRSGGVWTQQGQKLIPNDYAGTPSVGNSVALSADGNTAIVGGDGDNSDHGAVWVFTRSGGVWTQQGSKLVGNGAVGAASQGGSVALSADGNTMIEGGFHDETNVGAAWVFTRNGGVWTQQGSKFVVTGAAGFPSLGTSVALSTNGNIAMVGGPSDNEDLGATWVFTRSDGVWTQQGSKLVGSGSVSATSSPDILQGTSVALSADGTTAIIGADNDNGGVGATWIFVQPTWTTKTATHDFNGDGYSDIAWRDTSGDVAI